MPFKIAVLGGGSWGIAVANLLNMNGCDITLWEFNHDDYLHLSEKREHPVKLPGVIIPERVMITNDLAEALSESGMVCLAIPSHTVREVCHAINNAGIKPDTIIVNLAKGIEIETLRRMSEVVIDEISVIGSARVATLSGPSHAEEVACGMPTSVVVGCAEHATAEFIRDTFSNHFFRAYSSADIIGVETGGAFKNVIALASGIADGLGGGDNAKGALYTRGIAEISRLGVAMGANPETFAGLSGLGDLVTTCISRHSRNRSFGEKIGQGKSCQTALQEMTMVVEGIRATQAAYKLMSLYNIEMPITIQVYEVLFNSKNPHQALLDLMTRDLKAEF